MAATMGRGKLQLSPCVKLLEPSVTANRKPPAPPSSNDPAPPIINLGIGEMNPEFRIPEVLRCGIIRAIMNDQTCYNSPQGDDELLQALSEDLINNFGLRYSPEQLAVTPGPKDGLYKVCAAFLLSPVTKHDNTPIAHPNRVVAFAPLFEAFKNIPLLLTRLPPLIVPTVEEDGFLPDMPKLEELLRTRGNEIAIIILNSPNNPTGAVYPERLLRDMAQLIRNYPHIAVLSDEVYRTVVYDDGDGDTPTKHVSIAQFLPEQTFIVGGMSKEIAGTGLRCGFIAGPKEFIEAITALNGNIHDCVNLPTQKGWAEFLRADKTLEIRMRMRDELKAKRDAVIKCFEEHAGAARLRWRCRPAGAFYFFPDVRGYLHSCTPRGAIIETDVDLVRYLAEEARVTTIPGSKYGQPGYIRIAFANAPLSTLQEACRRISVALGQLLTRAE